MTYALELFISKNYVQIVGLKHTISLKRKILSVSNTSATTVRAVMNRRPINI